MSNEIRAKLDKLGLQLPPPIKPLGSYQTLVTQGDQLWVSGLGPFKNGKPVSGIVGQDLSIAEAQEAAQLTMLMILSCIDEHIGLDAIEHCLRLTVYVRADQNFTQHPAVANGATDLLAHLFSEQQLPARSAVGVFSLPMGIPVEIDSVFKLKAS
jgi:enamine deaminase RidA (YjgF/YER057c/UK114 family)